MLSWTASLQLSIFIVVHLSLSAVHAVKFVLNDLVTIVLPLDYSLAAHVPADFFLSFGPLSRSRAASQHRIRTAKSATPGPRAPSTA